MTRKKQSNEEISLFTSSHFSCDVFLYPLLGGFASMFCLFWRLCRWNSPTVSLSSCTFSSGNAMVSSDERM